MDFSEWLKAHPRTFPAQLGDPEDNTPYQNPLIGNNREETYDNVLQLIGFLLEVTFQTGGDKLSLSLGETATWGYIHLLECAVGAMNFEKKHRPKMEPLIKKRRRKRVEKQAVTKSTDTVNDENGLDPTPAAS